MKKVLLILLAVFSVGLLGMSFMVEDKEKDEETFKVVMTSDDGVETINTLSLDEFKELAGEVAYEQIRTEQLLTTFYQAGTNTCYDCDPISCSRLCLDHATGLYYHEDCGRGCQ